MLHDYLEGYIDDLMVKFKEVNDHVNTLRELFKRCKHYKLRTNPLKCIFGASSGNLGFTVHKKGSGTDPGKEKPFKRWNLSLFASNSRVLSIECHMFADSFLPWLSSSTQFLNV